MAFCLVIFPLSNSTVEVLLAAHCSAMQFAREPFIASFLAYVILVQIDRAIHWIASPDPAHYPVLHVWVLAPSNRQRVCKNESILAILCLRKPPFLLIKKTTHQKIRDNLGQVVSFIPISVQQSNRRCYCPFRLCHNSTSRDLQGLVGQYLILYSLTISTLPS